MTVHTRDETSVAPLPARPRGCTELTVAPAPPHTSLSADLATLRTEHVAVESVGGLDHLEAGVAERVLDVTRAIIEGATGDLAGRLTIVVRADGSGVIVTARSARPGSWSDASHRQRFLGAIEHVMACSGKVQLQREAYDRVGVEVSIPL